MSEQKDAAVRLENENHEPNRDFRLRGPPGVNKTTGVDFELAVATKNRGNDHFRSGL